MTVFPAPPTPALEPHERARMDALERTVRDGLRDFRRTGEALTQIRDNALYRTTHPDFETYLEQRWGFTRAQAGRLIDAADVARVLEPLGIDPQSERQARALKGAATILTGLEPEQQRMVARLMETASTGDDVPWDAPAHPAELRIMANVVQKLTPDTTVHHPQSGEEVPFDSLSTPERFEVARTHVDQKTQAYHEKQEAKANKAPAENVNWTDWCMNYAAQALAAGQRIEIVVERDGSGTARAQARIVDGATGEVLAEGQGAPFLKKAVLNLAAEVKG
ncbi:hypothetical protein HNQ07_000081 [Deinococcus metalli]|uniref:Uncharacterized protein n=1 Tax=Deinococcus metalli TaxID=1141878 RepID=A0A7W8KAE9_9DEIO|nr:hypothetical protein [Deinococcus metalli]MBB5374637.1 hypothetical protein [Deinococcus metalli]GHF34833.1 hypothetical protein GCM10017781_09600 [Deinococcus metalli]